MMPREESVEVSDNNVSAAQTPRPKLRASHTKSRHGCYNCKRRRVKCDEVKPICGTCSIRGYRCSFPSQRTSSRPQRTRVRDPETASQNGIRSEAPDEGSSMSIHPLSLNVAPRPTSSQSESGGRLNMTDLKLLQHYFLYTSKRMSLSPSKSQAWERVIPDIATGKEFLMHLLLALAGLDDFTDQKTCNQVSSAPVSGEGMNSDMNSVALQIITEHHQRGLKGLREELDAVTHANIEVLATGSMLLVGFAFASLRLSDFDPPHSDGFGRPRTDWLRLARGAASIIKDNWMSLRRSRLRHLFVFPNLTDDWKYCGADSDPTLSPPREIHSKRLSIFARGARQAIFNLRAFSDDLDIVITMTGVPADSNLTPNATQSDQPSRDELFEEHKRVIGVIEDMYMRILHVLHTRRIDPRASSDLEVLTEIEDTAVTSWPPFVSQAFISSLDPNPSFGMLEGKSFTLLAHLYLTLAILEKIQYLGTGIDREVRKINSLVTSLGNSQLVELMQWPMEIVNS